MAGSNAVGLVAVVVIASISTGALVSETSRQIAGVTFADFMLSLMERIDDLSPILRISNPVKAVTDIAVALKSTVTGQPIVSAEPFEAVSSLETSYVYLGILLNNVRVLISPALFHLAIISSRFLESRLGSSGRVRGEEATLGLAMLPLGLNSLLLGALMTDYPPLAPIAVLEILALSLASLIVAEAKVSRGDVVGRIRYAYRRYWRLIPLAVILLMASAAIEAWLVSGGVDA